jgi:large subunit ribosomal protein L9
MEESDTMKLILKEDVENLGLMGSVVEVKDGYGRNFLIPRNFAVEANPKNIRHFEHQKKSIEVKVKKVRKSAEDIAEQLSQMTLSLEARAGEEDKLFGSVTTKDIAEAISQKGVEVDRRKILLDEPIRRLGSYEVPIKIHQDVIANVKLEVKQASTEEA